jgi:hypothetical protein
MIERLKACGWAGETAPERELMPKPAPVPGGG